MASHTGPFFIRSSLISCFFPPSFFDSAPSHPPCSVHTDPSAPPDILDAHALLYVYTESSFCQDCPSSPYLLGNSSVSSGLSWKVTSAKPPPLLTSRTRASIFSAVTIFIAMSRGSPLSVLRTLISQKASVMY